MTSKAPIQARIQARIQAPIKAPIDDQPVALTERVARGNLFAAPCPSREVLKHVCSRWGVLILIALQGGTHRFSELRRKVGGVSEKMLAQSLQALVQDGFVMRVAYPVVPPYVEYSLTQLGDEVAQRVAALADWIELNLPRVIEAQVHAGAQALLDAEANT